jgi:hypothetical protein
MPVHLLLVPTLRRRHLTRVARAQILANWRRLTLLFLSRS